MYRSCIFCSADLGANLAFPRFPVGRTLAFDAAKGRLWVVCPKCARWNLTPLEERWEAVEDAERLFRDTRLRAQSENVGLARLPDGTTLVRVGRALPGELAVWRYGRELMRRWYWEMAMGGVTLLTGIPFAGNVVERAAEVARFGWRDRDRLRRQRVPATLSPTGAPLVLPRAWLAESVLHESAEGELLLRVPLRNQPDPRAHAEFRGRDARTVLARAMPILNHEGTGERGVKYAMEVLLQASSAEAYIRTLAQRRGVLGGDWAPSDRKITPLGLRALEMAVHEETERRAMEGELAALQAMWRQAEEIAAIADRLPDLPAPEPPRLGAVG
ncbi:MAG TPA: hypothetical protein VFR37_10875 [Longimicrobium sp.]|nr:hypothetical protein [Longimicrobium sp.]